MTKELQAYMTEQVNALVAAPSCCAEAKAVGQDWLAAVGTDKEAEATKKLLAEVEADIMPIDNLIAFAGSEAGVKVFGAEMVKNVLAHAEEIKKNGAKFCDCPACTACAAIIAKKAEL